MRNTDTKELSLLYEVIFPKGSLKGLIPEPFNNIGKTVDNALEAKPKANNVPPINLTSPGINGAGRALNKRQQLMVKTLNDVESSNLPITSTYYQQLGRSDGVLNRLCYDRNFNILYNDPLITFRMFVQKYAQYGDVITDFTTRKNLLKAYFLTTARN